MWRPSGWSAGGALALRVRAITVELRRRGSWLRESLSQRQRRQIEILLAFYVCTAALKINSGHARPSTLGA